MAGSLNKVMLIGNLGKDPELKVFDGGNSLARFPIATSETYNNKQNEKVTQTEWHTIVVRRGLAEVAEKYLHKGDKVFIEGKLKTRSWETQNGEKRYSTEIHADNMTMLSGPRNNASAEDNSSTAQRSSASISAEPDDNDDLPF